MPHVIGVLVADDFEDAQLEGVRRHLAGENVCVIAPAAAELRGARGTPCEVDCTLSDTRPASFDALIVLGGASPDVLREHHAAVAFVNGAAAIGIPVVALGHATSLLIETGLVRHRAVTSWPSIRTDVINAGGRWLDRDVVVDHTLITGRDTAALPAVLDALERLLDECDTLVIAEACTRSPCIEA